VNRESGKFGEKNAIVKDKRKKMKGGDERGEKQKLEELQEAGQ
jgi:hypothetical protein